MRDLRQPSGIFFAMLGVILCVQGIAQPNLRAPLGDFNVNLYTGVAMLIFGGALLWLASRAKL
jgi:hypothetical protein